MSAEILRVHPDEPQTDRIDYIVSCLRKGDVVAMPTDTFYGLAVDPVNLHAVENIYRIKSRQKQKPLSLLIASLARLYELARDTDPHARQACRQFWPGPLTIIVRAGTKLPLRSTANTGNVALRIPDAAIPRAVVETLRPAHHRHGRESARRVGVYPRRLRSRPDRRPHSSDRRWRTDRRARFRRPSSTCRSATAAGRFFARARFLRTKSSWCCNAEGIDDPAGEAGSGSTETGKADCSMDSSLLLTVLVIATLIWCRWVYVQIE